MRNIGLREYGSDFVSGGVHSGGLSFVTLHIGSQTIRFPARLANAAIENELRVAVS
jgi:hypothetical protein